MALGLISCEILDGIKNNNQLVDAKLIVGGPDRPGFPPKDPHQSLSPINDITVEIMCVCHKMDVRNNNNHDFGYTGCPTRREKAKLDINELIS